MNGTASLSPVADARDPAGYPAGDPAGDPAGAAVTRAIALIRVVGRLARSMFALGMSVKRRVDTARSEGREATIPGRSVTLRGVIAVVRKALLVADALRWRLRTPEVRMAMQPRPKAVVAATELAADAQPAPKPKYERKVRWPAAPDMRDPLAQLLERRRHPEAVASMRQMVSTMTDAEALNMIFTYLLTAAEMLGDVAATQRIEALIAQAVALFEGEDAETVVPQVCGAIAPEDRVVEEPVAEAPAVAPDATGRGPPLV
jgi:hypothetical protein